MFGFAKIFEASLHK